MSPKYADGMANSVDPNQTAPVGAVWTGSTLFAQAYLSENLEKLRYISHKKGSVGFAIALKLKMRNILFWPVIGIQIKDRYFSGNFKNLTFCSLNS